MPALNYFQTAEALRRERATSSIAEMAVAHRVSYSAMRQRLSYYGIVSAVVPRVDKQKALALKLYHKPGTFIEVAKFMGVSRPELRAIWASLGLIDERRQLAFWPIHHVPTMRVVHRKKLDLEMMPLSLFDASNTGVINAADRFIAEASGNDLVQLHAAAQ